MNAFCILGDSSMPRPEPELGPLSYADKLSRWFARQKPESYRKARGQYFTPPPIASFMAELCGMSTERQTALDVGAGAGVLSCALLEWAACREPVKHLSIDAYETDAVLAELCRRSLRHASTWAARRGLTVDWRVIEEDFVLSNAERLNGAQLFGHNAPQYTTCVMNPPYFKLSKSDPRARLASSIVHGQPNIYALCMAIAAQTLEPDGSLVSISPRSFATGDYFRAFRERLLQIAIPEAIHVFNSRDDAFREDKILQENVIVRFRRITSASRKRAERAKVRISTSQGTSDLWGSTSLAVPLSSVVRLDTPEKIVFIPTSRSEERLREWVSSWPETLLSLGFQISTGPVVAFRAKRFLRTQPDPPGREGKSAADQVPLLLLNNVRRMRVDWPIPRIRKPQWISACPASMKLLLRSANYVLVRRFTSKEEERRLVAAPLMRADQAHEYIGIENHLNYVHKPGGELSEDEAYGIAAFLNSKLMDTYFRIANGHTQVNATEVRLLPFPDIEHLRAIGRQVRATRNAETDAIVLTALEVPDDLQEEETLCQR